MTYMQQLQAGFKSLVQAGEAGRHSIDDMMGPVNGAISEISGAAEEIASLPGVPPEVGAKLQRVMRGIGCRSVKSRKPCSQPTTRPPATLSGIDERMGNAEGAGLSGGHSDQPDRWQSGTPAWRTSYPPAPWHRMPRQWPKRSNRFRTC